MFVDDLFKFHQVDKPRTAIDFHSFHQQQYCRSCEDQEATCYQRLFADIRIEREHVRKSICKPLHLVEHDVTNPTIWSLDEKEAQAVVFQNLLNLFDVRQMCHHAMDLFLLIVRLGASCKWVVCLHLPCSSISSV